VENVTVSKQQPETGIEPTVTAIFDVRSMPLEMLTVDTGARHMVSRILDRMDGPSRVSVAKFNSAI
jgi:FXSXX-COOH protein